MTITRAIKMALAMSDDQRDAVFIVYRLGHFNYGVADTPPRMAEEIVTVKCGRLS